MSVNPLVAATAELQAAVTSYVPEDMWEVRQEIRQLPEIAENVALAFRTYVQRLNDNYPIDSRVTEAMFHVFQGFGQVAEAARDVAPLFENLHAEEIRRKDAPRPNEAAWNV
ncbi:hypothetical protein NI17_024065 (plasmid) [Thermobifida halotolerans]|uniref:Uncharacterized protein n=1 Tax=Thermobifida halotolerans TaxID=483545 RepID=A0AA97M2Q2_9ACTN|nr:hypothetical protein [Thermobifida halotolerans]UOE22290.1 hypothetical protein NI17_024065 [Thermobifida halotolerans]